MPATERRAADNVRARPARTPAPAHCLPDTTAAAARERNGKHPGTEPPVTSEKDVLELMIQGAPLATVLEALTRLIESQAQHELLASILLLDPDGVHLRDGVAPSLPEAYRRAIDGTAIGPSVGSCGTAAYRHAPVIVTDIATDPLWADFRALALAHGLRACWSTPIQSAGGHVLGTFALYYRTTRGPTEHEQRLVDVLTRTAALAIERERADAERRELLARERAARADVEVAAAALEAREQELRDFVEHAVLGLHWVGADGRILWANQAEMDLLGYTRDEYIGHHVAEFHVDRSAIDDILRRLRGNDTVHDHEARLRCKDGTIKWVLISANVLWDGERFVHTRCFTRDISERKLAEQRLAVQYAVTRALAEAATLQQASSELLQAVCNTLGWSIGAVWSVDREARVLRCVDVWHAASADGTAFEALTRQRTFAPGEGLPGRVWASGQPVWVSDVVQDANFPRAPLAARAGLHTGLCVPIRLGDELLGALEFFVPEIRPPDSVVLEMTAAVGSQVGQFLERKRVEGEHTALLLREREQARRLRQLADAALEIDSLLGVEQVLQVVTERARQIIGARWAETRLVGEDADTTAPRQTRYLAGPSATPPPVPAGGCGLLAAARGPRRLGGARRADAPTSGQETGGTVEFPRAASWLAAPLVGRAGGSLGSIALWDRLGEDFTVEDESILVQLAQMAAVALEQARLIEDARAARERAEAALSARDEFLSIASHELRNPVAGLKGTAQLLRRIRERGRLDAERLDRYLATIERTSAHLATLTEDLLDVSRLQRGTLPLRPRPTELAALVSEAVARQQARTETHQLVLDLACEQCMAVLDPDRVEQIVTNLLDNAVKYSPDGGEVHVHLALDAEGALLQVRDRGIGLPPGTAEKIFEPFGRAPNAAEQNLPGLGLGLYICRRIAEQHGGRLWAESAGEGRGTTLALWLPLSAHALFAEEASA